MNQSNSPFHVIFIFRREDARSIENLRRIMEISRQTGAPATVIDKSIRGATEYVDAKDVPVSATVLVRPRDETQFASLAICPQEDTDWVLQFHDDDTWSGFPEADQVLSPDVACHWVQTSDIPVLPAEFVSLPSVFFGAIRQDVWRAFCAFLSEQVLPSPGADVVLVFWCREIGLFGPLNGYVYRYNSLNWSDFVAVSRSNAVLAKGAGWDDLSDNEAMQWTTYLDTLTSLSRLSEFIGISRVRQLAKAMLARTPPYASCGRVPAVATYLPVRFRRAMVVTRGQGRGIGRICRVMLESTRHPPTNRPQMLHGGLGATSLSDLMRSIDAQLVSCGRPLIEERARIWHEQLRRLQLLTDLA